MSIKVTIEGGGWDEIEGQLLDALKYLTRTHTPPPVATQRMDEPPLPDAPPELFAEAQRIFEEPKYDPDVIVRPASQPVPTCSVHNREMTYFPAGITKSGPNQGKPRGAFYKCGVKDGDKWCQQRRDAA